MSPNPADSSQSHPTTTEPSQSPPSSPSPPNHEITTASVHLIDAPDPNNGRTSVDSQRVTQLADSIRRLGLLNPITVKQNDTRYTLVAGLHRLRAIQLLSLEFVAVTVLSTGQDSVSITRLAENSARSNLSPVEEAIQLSPLVDADPNGIDGVAAAIGRTRAWIDTRLEIMQWPKELTEAVHEKKMPLGAVQKLARIPDPDVQREMIYQALTHGINTRTATEWLRQATSDSSDFVEPQECPNRKPEMKYETETTVNCFRHGGMVPLESTVSVRLCHKCIAELTTPATIAQSPNDSRAPNTLASKEQKPFPESLIPQERQGPYAKDAPA